jgi:hypothetical protein
MLVKDLEEQGSGLTLKRTPVTLTLSGLEAYEDAEREDMLGEDDEEDEYGGDDVELVSDSHFLSSHLTLLKY